MTDMQEPQQEPAEADVFQDDSWAKMYYGTLKTVCEPFLTHPFSEARLLMTAQALSLINNVYSQDDRLEDKPMLRAPTGENAEAMKQLALAVPEHLREVYMENLLEGYRLVLTDQVFQTHAAQRGKMPLITPDLVSLVAGRTKTVMVNRASNLDTIRRLEEDGRDPSLEQFAKVCTELWNEQTRAVDMANALDLQVRRWNLLCQSVPDMYCSIEEAARFEHTTKMYQECLPDNLEFASDELPKSDSQTKFKNLPEKSNALVVHHSLRAAIGDVIEFCRLATGKGKDRYELSKFKTPYSKSDKTAEAVVKELRLELDSIEGKKDESGKVVVPGQKQALAKMAKGLREGYSPVVKKLEPMDAHESRNDQHVLKALNECVQKALTYLNHDTEGIDAIEKRISVFVQRLAEPDIRKLMAVEATTITTLEQYGVLWQGGDNLSMDVSSIIKKEIELDSQLDSDESVLAVERAAEYARLRDDYLVQFKKAAKIKSPQDAAAKLEGISELSAAKRKEKVEKLILKKHQRGQRCETLLSDAQALRAKAEQVGEEYADKSVEYLTEQLVIQKALVKESQSQEREALKWMKDGIRRHSNILADILEYRRLDAELKTKQDYVRRAASAIYFAINKRRLTERLSRETGERVQGFEIIVPEAKKTLQSLLRVLNHYDRAKARLQQRRDDYSARAQEVFVECGDYTDAIARLEHAEQAPARITYFKEHMIHEFVNRFAELFGNGFDSIPIIRRFVTAQHEAVDKRIGIFEKALKSAAKQELQLYDPREEEQKE